MPPSFLIVIVGPTAVGKTKLSLQLAKHFNAEIISADSRQFFKEMNIGTAKPDEAELKTAKHHFINSHSITEYFSAGEFEKSALALLEGIFKKNNVSLLVGGSGLYVKALCEGMDDLPEAGPAIREKLNAQLKNEGIEKLFSQLKILDPEYAMKVDGHNPQRIIRALEIILQTGKTYSFFRKGIKKERPFKIIKIGLALPREELYDSINKRMDKMLADGLIDEARGLYEFKNHNALQTVGYAEVFDYLDGKYNEAEMIDLLKRNSRRYAKRQMTWFKRDKEIAWFHPDDWEGVLVYVEGRMDE